VLQVQAKHKSSKLLTFLGRGRKPFFWASTKDGLSTLQNIIFLKTNNEDKVCITTYIKNVVLLIGETTIHSLLGLPIDKNININKSQTIPDSWFNIQFVIVDEISMVGCTMLITMH
jgi:hypothetical protein